MKNAITKTCSFFSTTLFFLLFLFSGFSISAQTVNISGTFTNPFGVPVSGIPVIVNGVEETLSDADGKYTFTVPAGATYEIAPYYNENPSKGVSTMDLVLTSMHLLGINALNNPYLFIAADVSGSCTLSALDLVNMRKVILSLVDEFPNNTSWRFFDASVDLPPPFTPCPDPSIESIILEDVQTDQVDVDWVAVKIGDLNGSATSVDLDDVLDQLNLEDTNPLSLYNKVFQTGEIFEVTVSYPENSGSGMQMELAWDPDFLELIQPASPCGDAHVVSDVSIAFSWNAIMDGYPGKLADLRFRAKKAGQLSDVMWLDESRLKAESYNLKGALFGIELLFDAYSSQAILYQNYPNPVIGSTWIPFYLPRESSIRMSIFDGAGKMVWEESGIFTEGYHEIEVPKLEVKGLFYYRLETPENTATKKLFL